MSANTQVTSNGANGQSDSSSMNYLLDAIRVFTNSNRESNTEAGSNVQNLANDISSSFANINGGISAAWSDVGTGLSKTFEKVTENVTELENCLCQYISDMKAKEEEQRTITQNAYSATNDLLSKIDQI